jgi:hypothetical protein
VAIIGAKLSRLERQLGDLLAQAKARESDG